MKLIVNLQDYACEDEYFERDMTLLEARKLPLPLPEDFSIY